MWTLLSAGAGRRIARSHGHDARYAVIVVRKEFLYTVALCAICALLFFWQLESLRLWDIDEGMHAVIAQNMLRSGDWITPVFNGEPFMDKPAMFNWLCATAFSIFGYSEFAARLPAALLGTGCVLTTFAIGRKIFDNDTAVLAGVILATSLEFIVLSRQVQYDIPFTFFTTLSLYFFCCAYRSTARRALNILLFYVAAAFAVLTKGPLGLLLPGLAILIFLAQQREPIFLKQFARPHGLIAFAAVVLPWFVLMEMANPGYLEYFLRAQHFANVIGDFGDATARHPRPLYYYLPIIVVGFFPWSLMLAGASRQALRLRDPESVLLIAWSAAIFGVFSLSSSKLSTYVLPMFPAMALLVAKYVRNLLPLASRSQRRELLLWGVLASGAMIALAFYVTLFDPWRFWEQERGLRWVEVEIFAVLVAALLLLLLCVLFLGKYGKALLLMATMAPITSFTVLLFLAPDAEPYNSAAKIGMRYDRLLDPGEKMVFATRMLDSALFYSGREALLLESEEDLEIFLDTPDEVLVLLSQVSRTDSSTFDGNYYVIHAEANKAIVSNRPAGHTAPKSRDISR